MKIKLIGLLEVLKVDFNRIDLLHGANVLEKYSDWVKAFKGPKVTVALATKIL